jgi:copper(I)-binding protein
MRRGVRLSSFILAVVAASALGRAQQQSVSASAGWIAAPPPGSTTAAAYAEIQNPTMYDVYIVSASADAAVTVELREGKGPEAKPVKAFTVPAYGSLELVPGGSHALLKDLKRPLKTNDTVELTLTLDSGAHLKVTATVK